MGDLVRQIRGEFEKPVRRRLNVFYRVRTSSIRIDRYWEYRKRDKRKVKLIYIFAILFAIYKFQIKVQEYYEFAGYMDVYQFTSL